MRRILHLLSQRPSLTGSGVTLEALTRYADRQGWDQHAVIGVPVGDERGVDPLRSARVHRLRFGEGGDLPFPVVGMSDVMPYESTVWSSLAPGQISAYCAAWRRRIAAVLEQVQPDIVHSHHVWLMSSLVKDLAPELPQVIHCHATGLRQMQLCPHLAERVQRGCARADAFALLVADHRTALREALPGSAAAMHVVGAGYNQAVFHDRGRDPDCAGQLLFVGKFSRAKGLPWLLDVVAAMGERVHLHVAGGGGGEEAELLQKRMAAMPNVTVHGMLDHQQLAERMRCCAVTVLPSFYEGLPLVLAEAAACGNRLVATELAGTELLAGHLGDRLRLVPRPTMRSVDEPEEAGLPAFVEGLRGALEAELSAPASGAAPGLEQLTWDAVAARVESVWLELLAR